MTNFFALVTFSLLPNTAQVNRGGGLGATPVDGVCVAMVGTFLSSFFTGKLDVGTDEVSESAFGSILVGYVEDP